jgi:hypothetical protein
MYVVVFTTLLLAITTTSFIRIVLRDNLGSIQMDNSQAALNAADMGIETAKIALQRYHRCLTEGLTGTITTGGETIDCDNIIAVMRDESASTDCGIVQKIMGYSYVTGAEMPLGTITNVGEDELRGAELDQAVTCVLINEEQDNYRGALANSDPPQSKLVPLRTTSSQQITHVKVQWFAREDGGNTVNGRSGESNNNSANPVNPIDIKNAGMLNSTNYNEQQQPSALYVQFLQANKEFNLSELYMSEGDHTNSAMVLFVPHNGAKTTPVVGAANFAASNNKTQNQPIPVGCSAAQNFYCSAIIELPAPINGSIGTRNVGASFLHLMIPYGNPYTQYSVQLCGDASCVSNQNDDCDPGEICFSVQSTITSTGRAGDSFRRIETRVEFVDSNFPLPQYALNINSSIDKNFYVTRNNWGGDNAGEAVNMSTAD